MKCERFREAIAAGVDDASVREHLRTCEECLAAAVELDPGVLFRALGPVAAEPPGGTDDFVAGVMHQVHLRSAERSIERRPARFTPIARWSAAAALAIAVIGGGIVYRTPAPEANQAVPTQIAAAAVLDRPVIESYDSAEALIMEMPAEGPNDLRLVMIFDDSLPADL